MINLDKGKDDYDENKEIKEARIFFNNENSNENNNNNDKHFSPLYLLGFYLGKSFALGYVPSSSMIQ